MKDDTVTYWFIQTDVLTHTKCFHHRFMRKVTRCGFRSLPNNTLLKNIKTKMHSVLYYIIFRIKWNIYKCQMSEMRRAQFYILIPSGQKPVQFTKHEHITLAWVCLIERE